MADIWIGAGVIFAIMLLPLAIPIVTYFANRAAFQKYGVWLWLGAGAIELILLFLMFPLVV